MRKRATKAEMLKRRLEIFQIVALMKPMTVRQVFYQATVREIVPKTEVGYGQVQRVLASMRRDGIMPFDWIADNTRWQRKPDTFSNPADAARHTARFYRKALWDDAESYVEIWLEKDALASIVMDVTDDYDVPLMVSRGYASLSFLHSSAEYIKWQGKPTFIYHLGDYDPSGVNAAEKIKETLFEMAPNAEIHFERIAVTPEQIEEHDLPSRPTKTTDTRAKTFGDESVELDAMTPDMIRNLVQDRINVHLPQHQLAVLKAAEASERGLIEAWALGYK